VTQVLSVCCGKEDGPVRAMRKVHGPIPAQVEKRAGFYAVRVRQALPRIPRCSFASPSPDLEMSA
jgi:hypothetical protein